MRWLSPSPQSIVRRHSARSRPCRGREGRNPIWKKQELTDGSATGRVCEMTIGDRFLRDAAVSGAPSRFADQSARPVRPGIPRWSVSVIVAGLDIGEGRPGAPGCRACSWWARAALAPPGPRRRRASARSASVILLVEVSNLQRQLLHGEGRRGDRGCPAVPPERATHRCILGATARDPQWLDRHGRQSGTLIVECTDSRCRSTWLRFCARILAFRWCGGHGRVDGFPGERVLVPSAGPGALDALWNHLISLPPERRRPLRRVGVLGWLAQRAPRWQQEAIKLLVSTASR